MVKKTFFLKTNTQKTTIFNIKKFTIVTLKKILYKNKFVKTKILLANSLFIKRKQICLNKNLASIFLKGFYRK